MSPTPMFPINEDRQQQGYIISASPQDYLKWRYASGNTVEITDINVSSARRVGIGTKLVDSLRLQLPKQITLIWAITRHSNLIAQEFYENIGFRVAGVLRRFYQDDPPGKNQVDAIVYSISTIPEGE